VILDALIQNAGSRFQKTFADEPLLERLRILARDETADVDVRKRVNILFRQWAVAYDLSHSSLVSFVSKMLKQPESAKSTRLHRHLSHDVLILHTHLLRADR
jgi:hypothetical protein